MKKLIIAALMLISVNAFADRHHYYGGGNWVAPLIIGGVIGYEIDRHEEPRTVIIQQQPPVYIQQALPQPPYGYHYTQILDASCNCYKTVLVTN